MKTILICKKHYKRLMQEFENKSPEYQEAPAHLIPHFGNLWGLDVKFKIVPYLKKVRILDHSKFKLVTTPPTKEGKK